MVWLPTRRMAMKTVVALPGQGIGIEVVDATCELLMGTGLPLKISTPPQGDPVPEETKRAARQADGVLFGAAGPATSAVVAWLRWEMQAWAGVRPIRFFPGMHSPLADPEGIDYVLLRENSEGIYPGREGALADLIDVMPTLSDRTGRSIKDFGHEGHFAVKVVTPKGAERIARFACDLARKAEGQGQARQGHLRHQVELPAPDRRALPADGRAHRARSRPPVRALPRRRYGAAARALPEIHGRRAVHEPLRRHPLGSRRGDGGRPGARALWEFRRRRLGLLRIGPRLGPRHRGPGHRQPHRDHSLGRPHARAHGHGGRGAATRGRRRACLPRRQDAHP